MHASRNGFLSTDPFDYCSWSAELSDAVAHPLPSFLERNMPVKLSGSLDLLPSLTATLQSAPDVRPDLGLADVLQLALPGDVVAAALPALPAALVPAATLVVLAGAVVTRLRPAFTPSTAPA